MSCFKGDQRYTRRDDDTYDWAEEGSDEEWDAHLDYEAWASDNEEAVLRVYDQLLQAGKAEFGVAFFQCGSFAIFKDFVYRFTNPGATKSKLTSKCRRGESALPSEQRTW